MTLTVGGRHMQQKTLLDQEQLTKLGCDAYAFAKAAELVDNYRASIGAQPVSTAHVSLKTAMMVNAGLALELGLKLIHHRLGTQVSSRDLRTHQLVEIFDLLDGTVQSELEDAYSNAIAEWAADEGKTTGVAYITSASVPDKPEPNPGSTLRQVLANLDDTTLFLRRYSFETYSRTRWWIEYEVAFLMKVYSILGRYGDSLIPTVDEGN